jgi:hypothetical protein
MAQTGLSAVPGHGSGVGASGGRPFAPPADTRQHAIVEKPCEPERRPAHGMLQFACDPRGAGGRAEGERE